MSEQLQDKVAVITGGASGIGQACAVRFAKEGARIVVGDIKGGDETVALVERVGGQAIFVTVDTRSEEACDAMVEAAVDAFGHVDIGVAAAGIATARGASNVQNTEARGDVTHLVNLPLEDFTKVIDINLYGVMQTDRALARRMLEQGTKGSIINLTSSAGKIPLPGASPYCVSKAGVIMLTKVLALELAATGIRVNAVGPGYTATPMIEGIEDNQRAYQAAMDITPMHRLGTADEIAAACLFLASEEASFFTGQTLFPAGGQFTG